MQLRIATQLLAPAGRELRVRGHIQGERGRNVAPRRAKPTAALTEKYLERMASDRFVNWELFDDSWSDSKAPDLYAAVSRRSKPAQHWLERIRFPWGCGSAQRFSLRTETNV